VVIWGSSIVAFPGTSAKTKTFQPPQKEPQQLFAAEIAENAEKSGKSSLKLKYLDSSALSAYSAVEWFLPEYTEPR
jgi:hypothetical protein